MEQPTSPLSAFWAMPEAELLAALHTQPEGLTTQAVEQARKVAGRNLLQAKKNDTVFRLFLRQFASPISLILMGAAILSFFLADSTDGFILFGIILVSGLLGFWQEKGASDAMADLQAIVTVTTTVWRNGQEVEILAEELVPGDIVSHRAGDMIYADGYLLEANELFINEASLTGETFPVDKQPGLSPADAPINKRNNAVFMGSSVVSGSAKAVVVQTGPHTELGHLAQSISKAAPETDFERGIRQFGYLLMQVTLVLVILIFGINVFLHKPILEAFLFSMAIAVGLTPQLLPAIISINLAKGASRMAKQKVIVKRLSAIENIGSMRVLCSDKTGTLTEGTVQVDKRMDATGNPSEKVQLFATINAYWQQGFRNPIDVALLAAPALDVTAYPRIDEIPYDFLRKRLTILTEYEGDTVMCTKGAVQNVLDVCTMAENGLGDTVPLDTLRDQLHATYEAVSAEGYRTLALAIKSTGGKRDIDKADEAGMTFIGFITLFDPPKAGIEHTLAELKALGIQLKMITGDNALVAGHIASKLGLDAREIVTGTQIRSMSVDALRHKALKTSVFAEIEPNQKESIILALRKSKVVVGYMGDGINDASALHAADVGISVDTAVDVAKESADIVLLQQNLDVLLDGVREGRRTFANTMKYIFMATSANVGNMFSMAGASLFLPFLPLLPTQILLTNLLTDLPEMTIGTDNVEPDAIARPAMWDLAFIRKFMLTFGLLSSVFDYMSFGVLLLLFHANESLFQTGWFVESVLSAATIVLVVRSRRPFFKSQPGKWLALSTGLVVLAVLALPLTPLGKVFGFTPMPIALYGAVLGIVATYALSAELLKSWFYKRFGSR